MFAQASLYEPLVKYRDDGSVEPWLATSWNISEDGRTYDFVLRPAVTFSDGVSFDAAAVKANFDAILANRPRHAWLDLVQQIERTEVVGLWRSASSEGAALPDTARTFPAAALPVPVSEGHGPPAVRRPSTSGRRSAQGRGGSSTHSSAFPTRSRATRVTGARDPSSTARRQGHPRSNTRVIALQTGRSTSSTARADRFLRKPSSDFETWPRTSPQRSRRRWRPGARDELRALPDR